MSVQDYPLLISIYKGEGRILIIPIIKHIAGYSVNSDAVVVLREAEESKKIGRAVINTIEFIKKSPLSESTPEERKTKPVWKRHSTYKSELSFWKNNLLARIKVSEDGSYIIYSMKRSDTRKGGYSEIIKEIHLMPNSNDCEIGNAVINVFDILEEYYKNKSEPQNETMTNINLLDETVLTFKNLTDIHFIDCGDCGSAEIYQCYSYISNKNAESSAEIFLGIAPELDCNLEETNIYNAWEEIYGKAEFFDVQEVDYGIFHLRVEMKNKATHKISYFLQMQDDLLLECGLDVHQPSRRKKLDEKLVEKYEAFALSCKLR